MAARLLLVTFETLFVFWVALAAFLYWGINRRRKQILRRSEVTGTAPTAEEMIEIEGLQKTKFKALRGCALLAAAMLFGILSRLI
jgi:hypothetical protein